MPNASDVSRNQTDDPLYLLCAMLLAPLVPGLTIAILLTVIGSVGGHWSLLGALGSALFLLFCGLAFSLVLGYPAALLLGLPMHRLLRARGHHMWYAYAIAYALPGAVTWPLYDLLFHHVGRNSVIHAALGAACGAVAGAAFWVMIRPDQTAGSGPGARRHAHPRPLLYGMPVPQEPKTIPRRR